MWLCFPYGREGGQEEQGACRDDCCQEGELGLVEEKAQTDSPHQFPGRLIAVLWVYRGCLAEDGGEEAAVAAWQELGDGHAQGVDVAPAVGLPIAILFRGRVAFGAQQGSVFIGGIFHQTGGVKVYETEAA